MPRTVAIVGGGVIGLNCAYFLAKSGHRVILVDRQAAEDDRTSTGNAGMIVPSHIEPLAAPGVVAMGLKMMFNPRSPFRIKPRLDGDFVRWNLKFIQSATQANVDRCAPILRDLHLLSRRLYVDFARDHQFGLVQKGLLMVCQQPATLAAEEHTAQLARKLGMNAESLTPEALRKLEPGVRYEACGAIYFPQDCSLTPGLFLGAMRKELANLGVEMHFAELVTAIHAENNRVQALETDQGRIEADEFVVAGGSWSAEICRMAKVPLLLQAGKGYSMTIRPGAKLPSICSLLIEGRVAVTPMGKELRVGGTMEIVGLDESIDKRRVQGIRDAFLSFMPQFSGDDFRGVPIWKGLRPCPPDGMPYVGRFKRLPNLIAATGHGMMGLSLGPATGSLVAQVVSETKPDVDLTLLDPNRFA